MERGSDGLKDPHAAQTLHSILSVSPQVQDIRWHFGHDFYRAHEDLGSFRALAAILLKSFATFMLKPSSKAPSFRLQSDGDKTVALKDFKGKRVLLFFFPKANTPG